MKKIKRLKRKFIAISFIILILGCSSKNNYIEDSSKIISIDESQDILNYSFFIPVGSVVKLKNSNELIMTISAGYTNENKLYEKPYLFAGVKYPNGLGEIDNIIYFNENDVKMVCRLGYITEEHLKYEEAVANLEINSKKLMENDYVGLNNYKQDKVPKKNSDEIKRQFDILPIGTAIKEKNTIDLIIIGYLYIEDTNEIIGYACVSTPVGLGDGHLYPILLEDTESFDIGYLGFISDDFKRFRNSVVLNNSISNLNLK